MVLIFDKEEILKRPELEFKQGDRATDVRLEGTVADQFWQGGKCYIPVIYKGQRRKMHINRLLRRHDDR